MGETYPDYLKVDFSKYTLLVRTYYDFKDYERREFPLTENREEKVIYFHMHTETKVLDNQTNNKDDLVFQVEKCIFAYLVIGAKHCKRVFSMERMNSGLAFHRNTPAFSCT